MSWQETIVIVASIAGAVATLRVVLPFFISSSTAERKLRALDEVNKRLDTVESKLAERRFPVGLGRKTA